MSRDVYRADIETFTIPQFVDILHLSDWSQYPKLWISPANAAFLSSRRRTMDLR